MKEVSNQEFELAYNNKDNIKLIYSIIKKYRKSLPPDSAKEIAMNAIWRCLGSHDPERQKFTSSLYRYTHWECLKMIPKKEKFKKVQLYDNISYNENYDYIDCILSLPDNERDLIHSYFIEKLTFKEIAKKYNKDKEWASKKIRTIISKLKLNDGV